MMHDQQADLHKKKNHYMMFVRLPQIISACESHQYNGYQKIESVAFSFHPCKKIIFRFERNITIQVSFVKGFEKFFT